MSTALGTQRDLRVDFIRGLALIFIFWDHIPGNFLGNVTLRTVGFSDAAEVFVFLAGYASALAYGGRLAQRGYFVTALHILRRSWILYIAHVFLLTQLMALIFIANGYVETRDFVQETGLSYFVGNPERALVDGMLLRFKPGLLHFLVLAYCVTLLLPHGPWLQMRLAQAVQLMGRHFCRSGFIVRSPPAAEIQRSKAARQSRHTLGKGSRRADAATCRFGNVPNYFAPW